MKLFHPRDDIEQIANYSRALSWKCTPLLTTPFFLHVLKYMVFLKVYSFKRNHAKSSISYCFWNWFLEVYSFAQNTIFLHILKYGIPGSVLLWKRNKSWKIVNTVLSKMKCTPQELSVLLIPGDAYFLHYFIEK